MASDERPPTEGRTELSAELYRKAFGAGWETLEAKTAFASAHIRDMHSAGLVRREVTGPASHRMRVRHPATGEVTEVLMLGSNNYLGLGDHPYVKEKVKEAIDRYGVGLGGPPLLNGTSSLHLELEERIAHFKGTEAAQLYPTGYAANLGWATALLGRHDVLVHDALGHASLRDAVRMGRFEAIPFQHNRSDDLRLRLMQVRWKRPYTNVAVYVEGVYSVSGELAPLPEIARLCRKYGALLVVDDAHGTGVMGARGRGTPEHFGLEGRVDLVMGTFSKAFAVTGGFVAGSRDAVDYMRIFARSYMFSASPPPPVAAAVLAGLDLLERDTELVGRLRHNARYLRDGLGALGLEVGGHSAIIPIAIPAHVDIIDLVGRLHTAGVFVNGVAFPVVPRSEQRLRLSVMATFSEADLDEALERLARVLREAGVVGQPPGAHP